MWVVAQDAVLSVQEGRRSIELHGLGLRNGNKLPLGSVLNPNLADTRADLRRQVEEVWEKGGQISLGTIRTMNGGGAFQLPVEYVDFTSPRLPHYRIWQLIDGMFKAAYGCSPVRATFVVFRDAEAPGTSLRFDGGGVGRGEKIFKTTASFLVEQCLAEMLGEIGIVAHLPNGETGRVVPYIPASLGSMARKSNWLNSTIIEEWEKAYEEVPLPMGKAAIKLLPLPDTLAVAGKWAASDVMLAPEWNNASMECLILCRLTLEDLPPGARLRFRDLESFGGVLLNRPIGVILQNGLHMAVASFRGGYFDPFSPLIPVTSETVGMCFNEKGAAVVKMLQANGY